MNKYVDLREIEIEERAPDLGRNIILGYVLQSLKIRTLSSEKKKRKPLTFEKILLFFKSEIQSEPLTYKNKTESEMIFCSMLVTRENNIFGNHSLKAVEMRYLKNFSSTSLFDIHMLFSWGIL